MIEDVRWGVQLAGLAAVALGSALGCAADDKDFAPVTGSSTADDDGPGDDEGHADGAGGPPPEAVALIPKLTRVTGQAGLSMPHFEFDPRSCRLEDQWITEAGTEPLIETACAAQLFAGGAAIGDYDGDGFDDIYFPRLGQGGLLLRNEGDGTFADRTSDAALDMLVPGNGAAWLDVDGDGDLDLFVLAWNRPRHQLWINDGGIFTEEAADRGVDLYAANDVHIAASVAVGDYDLDGWPDLVIAEWSPEFLSPRSTRVLHNRGNVAPGHFEDETLAAGLDDVGAHPLGTFAFAPALVDLDDDGWPDLAVASDFGSSTLHWNSGDGTFDRAQNAGIGLDDYGMGATFGDIDLDGRMDWFVTSIYDPLSTCTPDVDCVRNNGNRLYRNRGERTFEELAAELEVYDAGWGWGTVAADLNDDGRPELLATNGWLAPEIPFPAFENDPDRLWLDLAPHEPGSLPEYYDVAEAAGFDGTGQGRGLVAFDFDLDGDLDILQARYATGLQLWRNDGAEEQGHWLKVRVIRAGRRVYNAKVTVERDSGPPLTAQTGVGAHFGVHRTPEVHFGLGATAAPVSVRVEVGDADPLVVQVEPDTLVEIEI